MPTQNYRLRLTRVNNLKMRVSTRIPAQLMGGTGVTITKANGVYTFDMDEAEISSIAQGAAAAQVTGSIGVDIQAQDSDLQALADNSSNGLWARTAAGTGAVRTITGTANEITATNGNGVSGNPTLSLPSALTFTGKTITGGTFSSPTLTTPALGTPSALVLTNATGTPASLGLANATGSPTLTAPILGTPASGNIVNCTGYVNTYHRTSLTGNVTLNNTGAYFDGPEIAQGSSGTWFVIGTATVVDTSTGSGVHMRITDGTNIVASASASTAAANFRIAITAFGVVVNPAGNLRITVQNTGSTNGSMLFNATGGSRDTTITAIRIA